MRIQVSVVPFDFSSSLFVLDVFSSFSSSYSTFSFASFFFVASKVDE